MKRASVLLLATVLAAGPALFRGPAGAQEISAQRPNLVLIVTDDQRWDSISEEYTPNVWNRLVEPGVSFRNAFVPNPLCCPSRATILTGRYSHGNGVGTTSPRTAGSKRSTITTRSPPTSTLPATARR